jgi:putative endonuclease
MTGSTSLNRPWFLYVVECADGTLYTGISVDVARRVREHNAGRGARYTASRRPVLLRATWCFPDHRAAMQAETIFKRKRRPAKERLIRAAGDYREGGWAGSAPSTG